MIKQDLYDNSKDSFVVFESKKQQVAFYPTEESQMFQGKTYDSLTSGIVTTESENTDNIAFLQRQTGSYIRIPSSHTPSTYIGATNMLVPYMIDEDFVNFQYYDLTSKTLKDLYATTDLTTKILNISSGVQGVKIPLNLFNTILTDEAAIANNGNSDIVPNYGVYYVLIKPKYVRTSIAGITRGSHVPWASMMDNGDNGSGSYVPDTKRRTIYQCNKANFTGTMWNFEGNPNQSGRLYGSVVEVWNATETTLKQTKVMMEDVFNFNNSSPMQFVLSPDIMGYDSSDQAVSVGDIIRVYPRETYFESITIELSYKDPNLKLENMIAFMINDIVRDTLTGSYEVYNNNGFTIDENGDISGTIINSYQISATDRYEFRKRIK